MLIKTLIINTENNPRTTFCFMNRTYEDILKNLKYFFSKIVKNNGVKLYATEKIINYQENLLIINLKEVI